MPRCARVDRRGGYPYVSYGGKNPESYVDKDLHNIDGTLRSFTNL